MPGGGTCAESIAKCNSQEPVITGKPNPFIIDYII